LAKNFLFEKFGGHRVVNLYLLINSYPLINLYPVIGENTLASHHETVSLFFF
jgi:hypothetical protein